MISVIVCSRQGSSSDALHERNVKKTASGAIDYVLIDNSSGRSGICAAYNAGVEKAAGDILVFMHEDVFFMEPAWDKLLASKFADPGIGLVGVAGTQYLFPDPPGWVAAGRPFIKGKVVHETNSGANFHLTVFSWDKTDSDVVAVDGLFFAIRKELFSRIRFDETTFDGFHFYDLDICMQIRATHRLIVTPDILIKHQSGGAFNAIWRDYAARFVNKYRAQLPATCTAGIPDLSNRVPFENFDLRGKIKQTTIG
jgi:glycosyltransferase involved in cell wall biosynthesis